MCKCLCDLHHTPAQFSLHVDRVGGAAPPLAPGRRTRSVHVLRSRFDTVSLPFRYLFNHSSIQLGVDACSLRMCVGGNNLVLTITYCRLREKVSSAVHELRVDPVSVRISVWFGPRTRVRSKSMHGRARFAMSAGKQI